MASIDVNKETLGRIMGIPKGMKLEAISETQHGFKIEVSCPVDSGAQKFLDGLKQRTLLLGYEETKR